MAGYRPRERDRYPHAADRCRSAQGEGRGEKRRKLYDEHDLFVLVTTKWGYWRLKYRRGGREKMLALGVYPDVMIKQARQRRAEARALLATGIDPGAQCSGRRSSAKATLLNIQRLLMAPCSQPVLTDFDQVTWGAAKSKALGSAGGPDTHTGGLSTWEGLNWCLRDPAQGRDKDGAEIETDAGVLDKRLWVLELELDNLLAQSNATAARCRL